MNWPHAPAHWTFDPGLYIVTAGTYLKHPYLTDPARLDFFQNALFALGNEFGWKLQAWAVLGNHYHFVAHSPEDPSTLSRFLSKLHMTTAKQLNLWDHQPGRKIWHQFWDSRITFATSYLARLNYVHNNPAQHGVIQLSENYRWCSAAWFGQNATPSFVKSVKSFKTDQLDILDDF